MLTGFYINHLADTILLEQAVSIGRQYFRPFIDVITGGIASGKYMSKAVWKPIESRWNDGCNLLANFIQTLQYSLIALRIKIRVYMHVKQSKFNLTQSLKTALEISGCEHLIE